MKKDKKVSIFILIFLLLGSIIFFATIGVRLLNKNIEDVIIIGNSGGFKKVNKRWTPINNEENLKSYSGNKFNVYIDNSYLGKYKLLYDDKWYLFKDNNNPVNYEGNMLALSGSIKYKVFNFDMHDIEDTTYVKKALKENDLSEDSTLTYSYYIDIDLNNDGKDERIYTISNKFPYEDIGNISFSYIFMIKDEKIIYLYKNKEELDDIYSGCNPYINSFIDIDEDDKPEIIAGCSYYSVEGTKYNLYKFNNYMFKSLVSD